MTQRLQITVDDDELAEIGACAARNGLTVVEWVRQTLRAAMVLEATTDPVTTRILAVRDAATRYAFPVGEVQEMNADIARGRG